MDATTARYLAGKIGGCVLLATGLLSLITSLIYIRQYLALFSDLFSWVLYVLSFVQIIPGGIMYLNAEYEHGTRMK